MLPLKPILGLLILAWMPASAMARCSLCTPGLVGMDDGGEDMLPLRIEISSTLDFASIALTAPGGGNMVMDPVSRAGFVSGSLSSLGGLVMTGSATVHGQPGRTVRIDLPVDINLRSSAGADGRISRLVTDLPPNPRIGNDGSLRFSFGGRLDVTGDMEGDYRGRIAITVDYQ